MLKRIRGRSFVVVIGIGCFALFLRLFLLDKIPAGISHDELDYVFNAKAVYLTGSDVTGTWNPLSLTTPPYEVPKAELPYLFIAPFIGPFNFSLFAARLPFVIANLFLILVIVAIAKKLFDSKTAIIAGLLMSINPWNIYFSRTSYDTPLAVLFYYVGMLLVLSLSGWPILLAVPFFAVAFFSYIGTKLVIVPLSIILLSYVFQKQKVQPKKLPYIVFTGLILCLVFWWGSSIQTNSTGARLSELLTPYSVSITDEVNKARRLSIQNPLVLLFENKITVYAKEIITRYFEIFSPPYLFLYGDSRSAFSVWKHGIFYYVDSLFLIAGCLVLFQKYRRQFFLFLALFFILSIPAVISSNGRHYAIRSSLTIPIFIIIISIGVQRTITLFQTKWKRMLIIGSVVVLYSISVVHFLTIYFLENPIYNSEGFNLSSRLVARYINLTRERSSHMYVVGNGTYGQFRQYLFFTNQYTKNTAESVRDAFSSQPLTYQNISYITCDENIAYQEDDIVIAPLLKECHAIPKEKPYVSIAQLSDGGEIYRVYNDSICSSYTLSPYPHGITLNDFAIEDLSEEQYCTAFITDLSTIVTDRNVQTTN